MKKDFFEKRSFLKKDFKIAFFKNVTRADINDLHDFML